MEKKGDDFLEEFIDLYKANICLWKVKSKDYSDKNKKNVAYQKLVEKLRQRDPDANKESVVKKINNLRSSFRKELKKVQASTHSGAGEEEIYTPHLWYYELLTFLTEQETPRESTTNIVIDDSADEIESQANTEPPSPAPLSETPRGTPTPGPSVSSESEKTSRRTTNKRKKEQHNLTAADKVLAVVGERLAVSRPEDDSDIVGRNVAAKLRHLPQEQRIFAERLINEVLFEAQLGTLNRDCRIQIDNSNSMQNNMTTYQYRPWQQPTTSNYYNNFDPNTNS